VAARVRGPGVGEGGRPTAELTHPLVATPARAAHKLRRDVGFVGLVFASFGSTIGAGWLFGAQFASSLAGPAAIISWLIGGSAMMLLALTHAELGGTYPVAGGSARFPHYAFGSVIGFTSGWVAFLGAVTVGPIMVEATLLYASNYVSSLTTISGGRPVLTAQGYVVAAVLLLVFCTINVLGVRWLAETNVVAVCWKILVPVVTVVALVATAAHGANFTAGGGFMPFGWKGVFLALSSGGVIFACLGFEQAVQLGGESRNPRRNIPLAIIAAMLVAIGLYVALQIAYIAALDPSSLSKGWGAVSVSGKAQLFAPFAGLATAIGLGCGRLPMSPVPDTTERWLSLDWHSGVWLCPYLLGVGAISYLSSFDTNTPSSIPLLGLHGPRNVLTFGWDILAVAVLSLAVYALAIRTRLPDERALENVGDLAAEAEAEDAEIRAL